MKICTGIEQKQGPESLNRSTTQKSGIKMFCLLVMFVYGVNTMGPGIVVQINSLL